MSNQEPHNQGKTKEEADVQKRRRFIKGAGVAAPVVLTLAESLGFWGGAAVFVLSRYQAICRILARAAVNQGWGRLRGRGQTRWAPISLT